MAERFAWDEEKNEWLAVARGITFREVADAVTHSRLALIGNKNQDRYPNQYVFIVEINGYAWQVPADRTEYGWYLRMAFPSRSATRMYLEGQ